MVKYLKVGLFFFAVGVAGACSSKTAATPAAPLPDEDDDTGAEDAGADAEPAELVVFVTSTLYNGAFGGLSGGDSICQTRAAAANLSGTFRAWLSDPTGSPSTRFTRPTVNYQLVDGTVVAVGWAGLTSGQLMHSIDQTELGMAAPNGSLADAGVPLVDGGAGSTGASNGGPSAWTDTLPDGTFNVDGDACDEWTAGVLQGGSFGDPTATTGAWTLDGRLKEGFCAAAMASLYCVQQ